MATYYANLVFTPSQGVYDRKQFATYDLTTTSTIVGGADGVWDVTTAAAAWTLTVENYDEGMYAQWVKAPNKPYVIIKCSCDTSVFNVTVNDEGGTTLYTFAGNYSVTPIYIVLTLDVATNGFHTWKLA
jgi:hypothetical protein